MWERPHKETIKKSIKELGVYRVKEITSKSKSAIYYWMSGERDICKTDWMAIRKAYRER